MTVFSWVEIFYMILYRIVWWQNSYFKVLFIVISYIGRIIELMNWGTLVRGKSLFWFLAFNLAWSVVLGPGMVSCSHRQLSKISCVTWSLVFLTPWGLSWPLLFSIPPPPTPIRFLMAGPWGQGGRQWQPLGALHNTAQKESRIEWGKDIKTHLESF